MDFSKFVEKAILYDKRNTFSKYDGSLDGVPDILKDLYRDSNPIDVKFNNIRFSSRGVYRFASRVFVYECTIYFRNLQ